MGFVVAVTGAIGAGKTTLASRLAVEYGALHLSSDGVRDSLSHKQRRSGDRVFAELHRRLDRALAEHRSVVLDSTGMSPRFRTLLRAHRESIVHVHLVLRSQQRFEERERVRTDRPADALPVSAFHRSQQVAFPEAPDITVETDELTPEDVHALVDERLRACGYGGSASMPRPPFDTSG